MLLNKECRPRVYEIVSIICFTCLLLGATAQSKNNKFQKSYESGNLDILGDKVWEPNIHILLIGRRNIVGTNLARTKALYELIAKKLLRQNEEETPIAPQAVVKDDMAVLVEHELEDSLAKKASALQEKPFVQHKGRNDFLVLKPEVKDPFVTIVPNDIYYNVEKRCVNWLDDCNVRGLRARLLQQVQSPYRR